MKSRFTIPEKRALWVLTFVVLISRSAFALLNDHLIFGTVFVDDAFYALSVARHIALGHGFTADGIHPTNGFQPLNTLLQSICFLAAGGDRFNGVRWCFALSALIEAAFIWACATLLSKMHRSNAILQKWWRSPAVIVAAIETFSFRLLAIHANGLETGLDALMIVLVMVMYFNIRCKRENGTIPDIPDFLKLGLLCGFLVLARIDGTFLIVILAILELRHFNGLRNASIVGGIALLISSPWWIYGLLQFGSLMPISGQSESIFAWHTQSLVDAANAAQKIFLFMIPKWDDLPPRWITYSIAALVAFAIILVARRFGVWRAMRSAYNLRSLEPLCFFGIFLLVYYLFIFRASWFLYRYWHPIEIVWLLLLSIAISEMIAMIQNFQPRRRNVVLSILAIIGIIVVTINIRVDRRFYVPTGPADLAEIGFWAREHPSVSVGTLQSGAAGFLADNVTNLDGKVNLNALRARQHDSLGAYICSMRFDYLVDQIGTIDLALQDTARFGYHYQLDDSVRHDRIFRRIPSPRFSDSVVSSKSF